MNNSIERILKKVKIDDQIKEEIFSLYGENFTEDKDSEIIMLVNDYYNIEVKSNDKILLKSIMLFLFNLISFTVLLPIYLSLYLMKLPSILQITDFYKSSIFVFIFVLFTAYIFFIFGYVTRDKDKHSFSYSKYIKNRNLVIITVLILSISCIAIQYIFGNEYPWAIYPILGLLNGIWAIIIVEHKDVVEYNKSRINM